VTLDSPFSSYFLHLIAVNSHSLIFTQSLTQLPNPAKGRPVIFFGLSLPSEESSPTPQADRPKLQ
jgi:hypothetical protein